MHGKNNKFINFIVSSSLKKLDWGEEGIRIEGSVNLDLVWSLLVPKSRVVMNNGVATMPERGIMSPNFHGIFTRVGRDGKIDKDFQNSIFRHIRSDSPSDINLFGEAGYLYCRYSENPDGRFVNLKQFLEFGEEAQRAIYEFLESQNTEYYKGIVLVLNADIAVYEEERNELERELEATRQELSEMQKQKEYLIMMKRQMEKASDRKLINAMDGCHVEGSPIERNGECGHQQRKSKCTIM